MMRTCLLIAFLLLWPWPSGAQPATKANDELQYTVIVSRHGVRTPTAAPADLAQYSAEPWPEWGAPPGYLTTRGRNLMKIFGAYYRSYFEERQTLRGPDCADTGRVYFRADNEQRTLETARALAEGMFPGCQTAIHSVPEDESDPLFKGLAARAGDAGRSVAAAALMGSIGGHPEDLMDLYRNEFQELSRVLTGCASAEKCAEGRWLRPPITVAPGRGDNLVDITGPLRNAATLAENLLLEYTQGMTGKTLGWGRLDASSLRRIMALHTAYADLVRRTPYVARCRGSNLLDRILNSLRQSVRREPIAGALGRPGDAALVLVGHDTNLSNLSGMLGISWLLPGYRPNDPAPGGALVFELWRSGDGKRYSVRMYYTAQSIEQMRTQVALKLTAPPEKAEIFLPGCGTASTGFACDWADFERAVSAAIDPAFVER